ncbi:MAG: lysoplasmalogenase family protein, partial [Oscillospiraceae bacterium]
ALLIEKPLKMVYGSFKPILFLYTAILSMTAASAVVAAFETGFSKVWVVMSIGGILFALSDLVLSGMYFGEGKNTKLNIVVNHTLYYAAQFTMAATILCIK